MDLNAEILRELAQLRGLSSAFSGVIEFDVHLHPLWMQLLRPSQSTLMGLATMQLKVENHQGAYIFIV